MPITMEQREKSLKVPAVCELFPLRDITDNIMVRTAGEFVAGYALEGVLSYFTTDGDRNSAKGMIEAMLRSLPDSSMRVQFRYEITEDLGTLLEEYVSLQRTEQSELMALDTHRLAMWQARERQGFYFTSKLRVYFVWNPRIHAKIHHSTEQKRKAGGLAIGLKRCIERARTEHEELLSEFKAILSGLERSMQAARLGPRRILDQELFEELKAAQRPGRLDTRPLARPEDLLAHRSVREQAAEASILNETESYLNIDGYLHSVVSLKELPDATMPGMLQKLNSLGFPVTISSQIEIPDQVKVLAGYKKRMKKMISAQKDMSGGYKSNPDAKEAQRQLEQIQTDLVSSSLKTAKLSLSIVVRTSRPAVTQEDLIHAERDIANRVQEVLNACQRMNGAKAVVETLAKRRIFIGTLPGLGGTDKREHDLLTTNAADLVPVDMPWTGTQRSPLILFETPYRQLIPFSPFDASLPNANGLIMGMSGTGKTLATQDMLLMATRAGALVSILERGDSYLPLVQLMGGEMIELSLDSRETINAWDLPEGETVPTKNHLSFLKNLVRYMLGEHTPEGTDIDLLDTLLMEAIASTYRRCGSRRSANKTPLFNDLASEMNHWNDKDRNSVANDMARIAALKMRAWVDDGPYAGLFDRPTTISLDNPWLYFNVERLKDDPRIESAMSLLIAHAATYRGSGQKGRRSITILDECWALLESPQLANVVVQLFRTARKRDASVWGISQTPEDFVGTAEKPNVHGAGIMKNAATKIIGVQPGDTTPLREHLFLNDTAINQIKGFSNARKGESSDFLITIGERAESTHCLRIAPSPIDYWIMTTYPRERQYRRWFFHQYRHLSAFEIYELLAERFPQGLSKLPELAEERSGAVLEAAL